MKQIGLDSLIEEVFRKLGDVENVYLTNDWAEGKESPFVDLVVVGKVNKVYMWKLIEQAECLINKKIRVAVFENNFEELQIIGIANVKLL